MAKVQLNAITEHFSGRIGDVVFRRSLGRLQATLRPKRRTSPPSADQLAQRVVFLKGVSYAKAALADPATRIAYENAARTKQMSAFATAMSDYFRLPAVQDIDVSGYRGRVGDKILVLATDDVEVAGVTVVVRKSDGAEIEQGAAVLENLKWHYTAKTAIAAGQHLIIEVTARDRPGNLGRGNRLYSQP